MPLHVISVLISLLLLGAAWDGALASSAPVDGQQADTVTPNEETLENKGPDCIRTSRIRGTRILDDRHVLVDMPGSADWVMVLRHRCPQLQFDDYFYYRVNSGNLCATFDQIQTRSGFSCQIDSFIPYLADDWQDGADKNETASKKAPEK